MREDSIGIVASANGVNSAVMKFVPETIFTTAKYGEMIFILIFNLRFACTERPSLINGIGRYEKSSTKKRQRVLL